MNRNVFGHIIGMDTSNWNQPRIIMYDHILNLKHSAALFDVDELILLDYIDFKIQHYEERMSHAMDNLLQLRHIHNLITSRDPSGNTSPQFNFNFNLP